MSKKGDEDFSLIYLVNWFFLLWVCIIFIIKYKNIFKKNKNYYLGDKIY